MLRDNSHNSSFTCPVSPVLPTTSYHPVQPSSTSHLYIPPLFHLPSTLIITLLHPTRLTCSPLFRVSGPFSIILVYLDWRVIQYVAGSKTRDQLCSFLKSTVYITRYFAVITRIRYCFHFFIWIVLETLIIPTITYCVATFSSVSSLPLYNYNIHVWPHLLYLYIHNY